MRVQGGTWLLGAVVLRPLAHVLVATVELETVGHYTPDFSVMCLSLDLWKRQAAMSDTVAMAPYAIGQGSLLEVTGDWNTVTLRSAGGKRKAAAGDGTLLPFPWMATHGLGPQLTTLSSKLRDT